MHTSSMNAASVAVRLVLLFLLMFNLGGTAVAQDYPSGPVRIIVPFAAGGGIDIVGRKIGEVLSRQWGKPVIIENIVGAATIVGMQAAARAKPDGHTLLLAPDPSLALYPMLYEKLPYDPQKDFVPVATLLTFPAVLAVSARLPVQSLDEFVRYAASHQVNYGSFGPGSSPHLHMELFRSIAKFEALHVPYRGVAPIMVAMRQNDVHALIVAVGAVATQVREGAVRALAIDGRKRSPLLPDVPTFAEAGFPAMHAPNWWAFVAPAGTPAPVVEAVNKAIAQAADDPAFRAHLAQSGFEAAVGTPAELARRMEGFRTFWAPIIGAAAIKAD